MFQTQSVGAQETEWEAPHQRGVEFYREGNFESAAEAFEWADRLGAPPSNIYNLARCYEQLNRLGEALQTYRRYLTHQDIPEDRRQRAQTFCDRLSQAQATVVISIHPENADILVNGELHERTDPGPRHLSLLPGEQRIEARAEGYEPSTETIQVEPQGEHSIRIILEEIPDSDQNPDGDPDPDRDPGPDPVSDNNEDDNAPTGFRAGPWTLIGTGIALGAAGFILDILAYVKDHGEDGFNEIQDYNEWYDSVGAMALAGDVLIGVAAAALISGIIWGIVDLKARRNRIVTIGVAGSHLSLVVHFSGLSPS